MTPTGRREPRARPSPGLLILGLALAAFSAAGVGPAVAKEPPLPEGMVGIRLVEAPESRRDDPRALIYVVDHVNPGARFSRRFEVWNTADEAIAFHLFAGAATIEGDEWVTIADGDIPSWVTIRPARLVVPPGEGEVVTAFFRVPVDASAGERYGVLWAAARAESEGIGLASQVGIRVYLSVGPDGEPPSSFAVSNLRATSDAFLATVTNTGERALDVGGRLLLSDGPGGTQAGPFEAPAVTLAVGATGTVAVPVPEDLPRGPWHAQLVLRSGRLVETFEATLTLPTAGQAPVVVERDRGSTWPIPVLAAAAAALAAATIAWRFRSRKTHRP